MKKILLIGCGNIGSRHLQSLLRINLNCKIYIIEKSVDSINIAKKRCKEITKNHSEISFNFFSDFSLMNNIKKIDLCIIATNSDVRLEILNEVSNKFRIDYLILEKVLFQKLSDYDKAKDIIKKNNIKAWVNCPRRELTSWLNIKKILQNYINTSFNFKCYGTDWSLGSNSIHFLDLLCWLFDSKILTIDNSSLKKKIYDSKRKGFIEFYGTLKGVDNKKNNFSLESLDNKKNLAGVIILESSQILIKIEENKGACEIYYKELNKKEFINNFKILLQSNLTHLIVEKIFKNDNCDLVNFEESAIIHKALLASLLDHYNNITNSFSSKCPIT